ncbi:hypothetical protein DFO70_11150 [Cytobacillus firmus]|uniref:Uncharacterized protein n=2 Tax=Cytobacillus TaxID=2675230 RepID=A0A366JQ69_CYTFI|nr:MULTISPECIES: hypothetical protein [Cytobacillus]RBP89403.1 hypothetical protein DFO70_11150 [Cytobacillus firmus]TDX47370.1 hypothetical protein DFO72_101467 [Cytobacillus oceanisediminis]
MIEIKTINNRRFMTGFELTETETTISIGHGKLDSKDIEAVEFDLIFDQEINVIHDLYIVKINNSYDYRLIVTYDDGRTPAVFEGEGEIFHRLMTVETAKDGTYKGDFVFIEELIIEESGNNEAYPDNSKA